MGSLSIWHIVILGAIVVLLFGGRGKISEIMGDFATGIKSFKNSLADDEMPLQPNPILLDRRRGAEASVPPQSEKVK